MQVVHRRWRTLGALVMSGLLGMANSGSAQIPTLQPAPAPTSALAPTPNSSPTSDQQQQLVDRMDRMEKQNKELLLQIEWMKKMIQQQQAAMPTLQPVAANSAIISPGVVKQLAPVPQSNTPYALVQAQDLNETPSTPTGDSAPFQTTPISGTPSIGSGGIYNPSPNPGGGGIAPGSFPYGTSGSPGFKAGWTDKDGFFLSSGDNKFFMRLTGQIQADDRNYATQHDSTDLDSFLVRRARLGVEGIVFTNWEYRLLPDFSNSQSNTTDVATPRILDAYINAHYWDEFQVEAGKFKQPFSYEQLVQDRFIPTVERSIIDQLVPARDAGVMVHGEKLLDDKLDYAFSIFNGEINDDYDQNNGKDLAARLVVRPLNWEGLPDYMRGLQLGASFSWGRDNEPISNTTPTTIRTPDQVPFLVFASGSRADGVHTRFSPEIVYFTGPFGLAAQYFYGQQHFLPTAAAPFSIEVPESGFYVMSSYVLTGETRTTYSQSVVPLNDFDARHPITNPGAWEFLARVSELRYGDNLFESYKVGKTTYGPLANPALYSQGATEFDCGFNWFLNKYLRVEIAYEHDFFLQPVALGSGPNGSPRNADSIITRLQLAF